MGLEACQSAVFRACHSYHSAAGRLVAKRPAASLVASLVVTLLLTACMLLGSWEARLEYRDTLSRSEAFKLFDATLDMFGGSPRTNEYKMSSSDGSNVLTKQAILKALEVDEAVLGLTYKGTRFEDVCLRPYLGGACTVDSAMYRLGLGREEVEALSQEELGDGAGAAHALVRRAPDMASSSSSSSSLSSSSSSSSSCSSLVPTRPPA